jgi:thymidylate synthase ThyX
MGGTSVTYSARILADSISEAGHRLTTFELTFPRYVLAEMNTHRILARNSSSSRAIPSEKQIALVESDPVIPEFGSNQAGMQAGDLLVGTDCSEAEAVWRSALADAARHARALVELGVHKQVVNRLLEPFAWHTVIATASSWHNFFAQRSHHHTDQADPAIATIATMAEDLYLASEPTTVLDGEWHLPLLGTRRGGTFADLYDAAALADELNLDVLEVQKRVSVARCARVSYLTHAGLRDMDKDLELYDRLVSADPPHWSPLEHVARPCRCDGEGHRGCFMGWDQHRHDVERRRGVNTYR